MSRNSETVEKIIEIINENNTTGYDLVEILSNLMFSIGSSIEGGDKPTAEDIIKNFATNPTLGNALMAQALHMKETWTEKRESNERTDDI